MLQGLYSFLKSHIGITDFELPLPPSINRCYRSVNGRSLKSREYRQWIKLANMSFSLAIGKASQVKGPHFLLIAVREAIGWNPQRDMDNLLKPVQDWVKNKGLIREDNCRHIPGCCSMLLPAHPGQRDVKMTVYLIPCDQEV